MRVVTIPPPVQARDLVTGQPMTKRERRPDGTVTDPVEDEPWTLRRFLIAWVLVRPEWTKTLDRMRVAYRIIDALDAANGELRVSDEQWRHVKATLEAPDFEVGYPLAPQIVPLADAWLEAKDE